MADRLDFELVTPQGPIAAEKVDEVVAPGAFGEFGARPGHQPYLVELTTGVLRTHQGGRIQWYAVTGGLAEVQADRVTVLADACEPADAIDVERADAATGRAQQRLQDSIKDATIDGDRARAALRRAEARLRAAAAGVSRSH